MFREGIRYASFPPLLPFIPLHGSLLSKREKRFQGAKMAMDKYFADLPRHEEEEDRDKEIPNRTLQKICTAYIVTIEEIQYLLQYT